MSTIDNTLRMTTAEKGNSAVSVSTSFSAFQRCTRRGAEPGTEDLSSGSKGVEPKNLVNSPISFESNLEYLFEAYKIMSKCPSEEFSEVLKPRSSSEELKEEEGSTSEAKKSDLGISFTQITGTSSKRSVSPT